MKKFLTACLSLTTLILILLTLFARPFMANLVNGRVHFPRAHLNQTLTMEDGRTFGVFRRLLVDPAENRGSDRAVFKVRFQFKNLPPSLNKRLSLIPTPFLIGMKGFQEKYWTYDDDTDFFQGIYQWQTLESAENYPHSFIFRLMTQRAVKGTLAYDILPDTDLVEYIQKLSKGRSMTIPWHRETPCNSPGSVRPDFKS